MKQKLYLYNLIFNLIFHSRNPQKFKGCPLDDWALVSICMLDQGVLLQEPNTKYTKSTQLCSRQGALISSMVSSGKAYRSGSNLWTFEPVQFI